MYRQNLNPETGEDVIYNRLEKLMGITNLKNGTQPHLLAVDRRVGATSNQTQTERNQGTKFPDSKRTNAFKGSQFDVPYPENMDYNSNSKIFPFIDFSR